jgi:hypothetical protein
LTLFQAGQRQTAQGLRNALLLAAYKAGDQTVSASTTLVNDTALVLPLAANAKYLVQALLYYAADVTGDFKWNFTAPSGATSPGVRYIGLNTSLALQYGNQSLGAPGASGGNGTGTVLPADLSFTVSTTGAGNLTFQFAQNSGGGTSTTIKAGSSLVAWQLQ